MLPITDRSASTHHVTESAVLELGFHQGTVEGISDPAKTIALAQMAEYYRSHGVREWFIDRIISTPPENMWFPAQDELKEGGVLK